MPSTGGEGLQGEVPLLHTGGGGRLPGEVPSGARDLDSFRCRRPVQPPSCPSPLDAAAVAAAAGGGAQHPSVASGLGALRNAGARAAGGGSRVTILVNIWINHQPTNIEPLPDTIVTALTPTPAPGSVAAEAVRRLAGDIIGRAPGAGGGGENGEAGGVGGSGGLGRGSDEMRGREVISAAVCGWDSPVQLNMGARQGPRRVLLTAEFGRGKASHRLRIALPEIPLGGDEVPPGGDEAPARDTATNVRNMSQDTSRNLLLPSSSVSASGVAVPGRGVERAVEARLVPDTVHLLYPGEESYSGTEGRKSVTSGEDRIAGGGCVDDARDWTRLAMICAAEAETAEAGEGGEVRAAADEGGQDSGGGDGALAANGESAGVGGAEEAAGAGDRASKRKRC